MSDIHPTAVIGKGVKIGKDVKILPYCVIDGDIEIGDGCVIGPFAHITGWVNIGRGNKILSGAVIGTPPQDYAYDGSPGLVEIGDDCILREAVTIHTPVVNGHPDDTTRVGNKVFLMVNAHVAHNAKIGDNTVIVNNTAIAGYSIVENNVFLSANIGVHQFCRVGAYSIVGAVTKIVQDVPPYAMIDGHPAVFHGLNVVGLRRNGFAQEARNRIKEVYQLLYGGKGYREACDDIEAQFGDDPYAKRIVEFVRSAKRGIIGKDG